ncbi:MAG TPA: Hsp20/alpha crystallin family protein [Candidatus Andersenbacteria bacterium]|nr:Hsp20/alpha crystallin family protein [Candidatus Andersenbacteria bacterium]
MPQEPRSFFERLTGAKVLSSPDVSDSEEVLAVHHPDDDEYAEDVNEALMESDQEPEEDFSDENGGSVQGEEQEGQLTVDVFQDDESIIISSTVAGVSPDDLDVSITNDMVAIRGERRSQHTVDPEDYFYQECYWGTFSRSIILPVEIDADRAEAKLKNGILTIRIPKANAAVTRKLKVKSL